MRRQRLNQRPPEFRLDAGHPLANGLVFAGCGNAAGSLRYYDSSGRQNHGVLTNGATWGNHPTKGAAAKGESSVGGYVCADLFAKCPFSVAVNAYVSVDANSYVLKLKSEGWPDGLLSTLRYSTYFRLYWQCYYGSSAKTSYEIADNSNADWVHAAVVCATDKMATYSNGRLLFTSDTPSEPFNDVTGIELAGTSSAGTADCLVTDVLVWNRIVSHAEISALADPSNVMLSGLIVPPRRKLFTGGGAAPPAALEATVAQTLPKLSQACTASATQPSASLSQTLPHLSQAAAASAVQPSASLAQTLPRLSQACTASATQPSASLAQTLPRLVQAASATATQPSATLAQTLPRLAQSASATAPQPENSIAQTLPRLSQSASVTATQPSASAAQTLPRMSQSVSATATQPSASLAQTLPRVSQACLAANGTVTYATVFVNGVAITLADGGQIFVEGAFFAYDEQAEVPETKAASMAQTLPRVSQAVAVTATQPAATVAQTLPRLSQACVSSPTGIATATVAQTLPRLAQSAAATNAAVSTYTIFVNGTAFTGDANTTVFVNGTCLTFSPRDLETATAVATVAQTLPRVTQQVSAEPAAAITSTAFIAVEATATADVYAGWSIRLYGRQTLPRLITEATVSAGPPVAEVRQTLPRLGQAATVAAAGYRAAAVAQTLPRLGQTCRAVRGTDSPVQLRQTLPRLIQRASVFNERDAYASITQTLPRLRQRAYGPYTSTSARRVLHAERTSRTLTASGKSGRQLTAKLGGS